MCNEKGANCYSLQDFEECMPKHELEDSIHISAREMNKHWRGQTQQVLWDWVEYDRVAKFENFNEEFRLILKKIYPQIAENQYNDILDSKINHATHANLKLEKFYTRETQEVTIQVVGLTIKINCV